MIVINYYCCNDYCDIVLFIRNRRKDSDEQLGKWFVAHRRGREEII